MATYPAIAATSQAILGLLESASSATEFSGTEFRLYGASDLQGSSNGPRVSLYLYQVSVNVGRRNLPSRTSPSGQRFRPFPLDLHYLLTAWSADVAMQQRLLGWCIRTVEDTPILPAGLLNHFGPDPDVFRPDETMELIWEPLSQQDLFDIWEVARANQQPSASYLARTVVLESPIEEPGAGLVHTTVIDYGELVTS